MTETNLTGLKPEDGKIFLTIEMAMINGQITRRIAGDVNGFTLSERRELRRYVVLAEQALDLVNTFLEADTISHLIYVDGKEAEGHIYGQ